MQLFVMGWSSGWKALHPEWLDDGMAARLKLAGAIGTGPVAETTEERTAGGRGTVAVTRTMPPL